MKKILIITTSVLLAVPAFSQLDITKRNVTVTQNFHVRSDSVLNATETRSIIGSAADTITPIIETSYHAAQTYQTKLVNPLVRADTITRVATPTQIKDSLNLIRASITNSITGTGVNHYLSHFTATKTLDSASLFWNGNYLGIGSSNPQSSLHIQTNSAGKAWQVRDKDGTLRSHMVTEGAGGINGMGLFNQTYLAFQTSESSLYPQGVIKQLGDYFNIYSTGNAAENKLYLYSDGEMWLWPSKNGAGVNAVYMVNGNLAPLTDLRSGVTLGSSTRRWSKFYSSKITDDGSKIGINTLSPSRQLDIIGTTRVSGSVQSTQGTYFYADSATNSAWKTYKDGDTIKIARLESGVWVTKCLLSPDGYLYRKSKNLDSLYLVKKEIDQAIDYALTGTLQDKGNWDASGNTLPSTSVLLGDKYTISGKGFISPDTFYVGDVIIAKIDNPGQTVSNWNHIYANQPKTVTIVAAGSSVNPAVVGYTGTSSQAVGKFNSVPIGTAQIGGAGVYLFYNGTFTSTSSGAYYGIRGNALGSGEGVYGSSVSGYGGYFSSASNGTPLNATKSAGTGNIQIYKLGSSIVASVDYTGKGTFNGGLVSTGVPLDSNYIKFTKGSYNTNIGLETGKQLTTGVANSNFGYNAGKSLTTGTGNVNIGSGVAPLMKTASDNILIGNGVFNAKIVSVNSFLVIDNNNDTVTNFIRGDMTADTLRINAQTRIGKGTNYTEIGVGGKLTTTQTTIAMPNTKTPASSSDTGTKGDICWDENYIYICTATNTWKRSAISTW